MNTQVKYFETDDSRLLWRDLINEIPPYMSGGRENPANTFDIAKKAIEDGVKRTFTYTIMPTDEGKVAYFNDAPGMTEAKFEWFMRHLSASDPDKPNGGRDNYGIGVRTAALKASPEGVEVFTKRDGLTLRGKFAFDGSGYGPVPLGDGELFEIVEGFPKWLGDRKEGTLVIEHGTDAVNATTKYSAGWSMARRWWRIPSNVTVSCDKSLTASHNGGNFVPLYDGVRPRKASGMVKNGDYECVTLPDGIKLHFSILSKAGSGTKRQIGWANYQKGFGGVVYRDEVYSFLEGGPFSHANTHTGLRAVWDRVAVFVELPDDYEVSITKLRDQLKYKSGATLGDEGAVVNYRDASKLIRENMPDFIREAVRSATRSIQSADEAKQRERLAELLKEMKLFDDTITPDPNGSDKTDGKGGGGGGGGKGKGKGKGKPGGRQRQRRRDDGDLSGKRGKGTMQLFEVEFDNFENGDNRYFLSYGTNADGIPVLYWNTTSRLSLALRTKVEKEVEKYHIDEGRWSIEMHKAVKATLMRVAGDPYVQLHFNMQVGNWNEVDKENALTPASLSLWVGNEIDFQKSVIKTIHAALSMEAIDEAA